MFGIDGSAIAILLILIPVYFLPAIIANFRKHSKKTAIRVLNVLAGWTFVGWIVAAVWAYTEDNRPNKPEFSATPKSVNEIGLYEKINRSDFNK
jgi:hypothetical protein